MMTKTTPMLIKGGSILQDGKFREKRTIVIEGNRIKDILDDNVPVSFDHALTIDASGLMVVPGLIDLHLHVCFIPNHQTAQEHFTNVTHRHASFGTTRFLASFCTASLDVLRENVSSFIGWDSRGKGALALGIHVEGPFINKNRAGAQAKEYILPVTQASVASFVSIIKGQPCIVAFAPEEDDKDILLDSLVQHGVIPAFGHTDADFEQSQRAIQKGVSYAVHLFNQMRPLHHRDPGVVGAVLDSSNMIAELIADGIHLDPAILRIIWKIKGPEKIVLASDNVLLPLVDAQEPPRLRSGKLAGGGLALLQCVYKFSEYCDIPLAQSIEMATLTPAKVLGVEKDFGSLLPGKIADVILLSASGDVMMSIIDGGVVYNRLDQ
ncbi:MAG: N-acetylglucosamine-6-phosphate deacetylase [Chlamydiota bacterium]|nr:N-acetylglucosamine-6-phosphate deacetylase [Chlamydiota bacterium]